MENEKVLKKEELTLHSDITDCWVIVNGKVWDVTNYLVNHPGGADGKVQVAHNRVCIADKSLKSYPAMPDKMRPLRIIKYTTPTFLNEPCQQHVSKARSSTDYPLQHQGMSRMSL